MLLCDPLLPRLHMTRHYQAPLLTLIKHFVKLLKQFSVNFHFICISEKAGYFFPRGLYWFITFRILLFAPDEAVKKSFGEFNGPRRSKAVSVSCYLRTYNGKLLCERKRLSY
jgi:hypothetical protein